MSLASVNLLVFREDRRCVAGRTLKAELLRACDGCEGPESTLRALLRAGELECGVADAVPELAAAWQKITDRLADALLSPQPLPRLDFLCASIQQAAAPDGVAISKPEGFSYYALHPLGYADALQCLPDISSNIAVIGIRSIGTTLSAIVTAAARKRGASVSRITVRPVGHPYDRHVQFTPEQRAWIGTAMAEEAGFLVVDEGPGLSGSSFISVGEALLQMGAPGEKITLICGHQPDLNSLRAPNGSSRARQFRWIAVNSQTRRPSGAAVFAGGGEWRRFVLGNESEWPASWTNFERLKYWPPSPEGEPRLFKFAGFGHYGDAVIRREEKIASAGFGPKPRTESDGFASYPWVQGRPMRAADLSAGVLARLAAYCAFRAQAFPSEMDGISALQRMAEHNLQELRFDLPVSLRLQRPVIADSRMQPHEWLLTPAGQVLKTDSGSHGDDHFFPGPTDIAWDLAGAIVEWRMPRTQADFFLEAYRVASGDDPSQRIGDYLKAYAAYRCAYCIMAGNALQGGPEALRMERAAANYGALLLQFREAGQVIGSSS
jgi:hypothetical protein